jgi:hypothetical protein
MKAAAARCHVAMDNLDMDTVQAMHSRSVREREGERDAVVCICMCLREDSMCMRV